MPETFLNLESVHAGHEHVEHDERRLMIAGIGQKRHRIAEGLHPATEAEHAAGCF